MGFLIKLKGKKLEEIQTYLEIAVDKILEGNIIAFPTDSVYGLGGDPLNISVIDKTTQLSQQRPEISHSVSSGYCCAAAWDKGRSTG